MLFNSYVFLCLFLPLSVISFYLLNRWSRTLAIVSLVAFSLVYYAYWNYVYVPLLVASILANFGLGRAIQAAAATGPGPRAKALMVAGIAANLALLAYFKYAYFIAGLFGAAQGLGTIVLPLAISFYTFQQIMYLVDSFRGDVSKEGLLQYSLYVMFFPHLIAGPLVHHREMMPQFSSRAARGFHLGDLSVGLTIFVIGLANKVLIADDLAQFVTPTFAAAAAGTTPDFYTAWCAVLSYTFQIYFDFSGYSDMAVGAARLFGIRLPINFFSPYRATSIIDFWRWWHMTLSRLLRNYLYSPLGGNRKGKARRYVNLMLTMLLGGLWHGAGWTFVVWGGLHGAYLVVNHAWRALKAHLGWRDSGSRLALYSARLLTLAAVVLAWVFFRAEDLPAALRMLSALAGGGGWSVPARIFDPATVAAWGVTVSALPARPLFLCLVLLAFVWLAPNTYEFMRHHDPALLPRDLQLQQAAGGRFAWRPSHIWALGCAALLAGALLGMLSGRSEFLYYQF
jgi:D-alanyl-lipoteichoic acid acyltransferase DltB (MBOAT superfamily)